MNKSKNGIFGRFFMHSQDMLCVMDNELKFERLNPAWLENLGYKTMDLKEEKIFKYVHDEDVKNTLEKINSLKNSDGEVEFKNRFKHKSGSYLWLKWLVLKENNKLYALVQNIKKPGISDQQINKEEVLFRSLVQNMVGALSLHKVEKDTKNGTLHYKFVDVNRAY
ncbi:MAG: PAS domain-containing protein [Bacteroidales bacterium]|nr:PAS domain-containing protein [Bacteroidales bacterium]